MSPAWVFLAFGILYLAKPDILQAAIRARTTRGCPFLSVDDNKVYMRVLGVTCLVLAVWHW